MVAATDLARQAAAVNRKGKATTYVEREFLLVKSLPASFGVGTGEQEAWTNPRTGWEEKRERLAFLGRKVVRLVRGEDREGEIVTLEVPTWLLERNGLG